jgi:hypothetical protein
LHVLDPALEEGGQREPGRIDGGAIGAPGDQTGAFDLRVALGPGE